ncbi:MAG: type III pantothenate kinase [Deferribacteres bacterium]|nr:type III pantothenate kinase [candidate division KSB1 bacterium]MCB9502341.1 type III pantothenate kinase [Deferribacteres bacterium]
MILAMDVGNTNITLGLYENGQLTQSWRLSSQVARTEDEIWVFMNMLGRGANIDLSEVHGIALGSVVPSVTVSLLRLINKHLKVKVVEVSSDIELGITIKNVDPHTVGADRICNAVAGFEKYGGPLVIVDFGTATTFDIVSDLGEYLGGIIAPGVESTAKSLHHLAAKLPMVDLKFPENIVGRSTESSMQSGLMFGGAEMVEGLLRRLRGEMGENIRVIATGGLAPVLLPELPSVEKVEPTLTLRGLYEIYLKNR